MPATIEQESATTLICPLTPIAIGKSAEAQ
jgi:hypothetical protein